MSERLTQDKWLISGVYAYWALHVLSWWIFLNSNHNESWFPAFNAVFGVALLPLNVLTLELCGLIWGSTNIFEVRVVVGLMTDFAIASVLSATILLGALILVKRGYLRLRAALVAHRD